ncbi:hypothetical protein [Bordetella genomosp. 11]|uniref:Uncharacterized protein n=1 Tax=Bordetella genomosp. 11 TaxID=1416808 RepID=A0A261UE57_9BORD|nr:hypothetical protein [Bordetella genomosp. 11]OZI59875.1 hypothetical protein CAL28_10310 [Bordetella genomosp. 11]
MEKSFPRQGAESGTPRRAQAGSQAKVFPPDSPVDVPNLPRPPQDPAADEARNASQPVEDAASGSSWADNTKPAPYKKRVRDSNIF